MLAALGSRISIEHLSARYLFFGTLFLQEANEEIAFYFAQTRTGVLFVEDRPCNAQLANNLDGLSTVGCCCSTS
jgi:hypothetical protein